MFVCLIDCLNKPLLTQNGKHNEIRFCLPITEKKIELLKSNVVFVNIM